MRIAQISTPHIPTPPPAYGGSELIASHITEELVRRGHQVTLFATPDSRTAAILETFPQVREATSFDQRELIHVANALKHANDFDIIHNHCLSVGPAFAHLVPTPMISTLHYVHHILQFFPDHNYVAVSHRQKSLANHLRIQSVIHNAIDPTQFVLEKDKDDYLLFLGRFHPNKGVHVAIDVANRSGCRLLIAGPYPPDDQQDYFDRIIKPQLTGKVEYIGEVKGNAKKRLLAKAKALILPSMWDEPFGLVLLEAMASGTPVIATDKGSVPELVLPGKTGFIANNIDEMVRALGRSGEIDPLNCRRHVEQNFSIRKMVDKYVALYDSILSNQERLSKRTRKFWIVK